MNDRSRFPLVALIAGYNVVQNLVLPDYAYVPANLGMTAGLIRRARVHGCTWEDLGLGIRYVPAGLRLGAAGAFLTASATVAAVMNAVSRRYFLDARSHGHSGEEVWRRSLIRFPLGTALFEEVAFRGVFHAISRRRGATEAEAALATAMAFGLWHIIPATRALEGNPLERELDAASATVSVVAAGVLSTAGASLALAWMRHRSKSLVAPWLTHAALNTSTYLCGVWAWKRFGQEQHASTRGSSDD